MFSVNTKSYVQFLMRQFISFFNIALKFNFPPSWFTQQKYFTKLFNCISNRWGNFSSVRARNFNIGFFSTEGKRLEFLSKWLLIFAKLDAFIDINIMELSMLLWRNSDNATTARMLLEIMEIYWCRSQWSVICAVEKCLSWFNCKLSIRVIIISVKWRRFWLYVLPKQLMVFGARHSCKMEGWKMMGG